MASTRKNQANGPKPGAAAASTPAAAGTPAAAAGTPTAEEAARSQRRAQIVLIAGELFATKGYRATTVREIADAAGILSGSLYHHFDSKESIVDEILSRFIDDVLADYRAAVAAAASPRAALEQIVRSTTHTLTHHRAALAMLQSDWRYFSTQPRFAYLPKALRETEKIWITQLELGKRSGLFRADLDPKLTFGLIRDMLWVPAQWGRTSGYTTCQVVEGLLRLLFDGIAAGPAPQA